MKNVFVIIEHNLFGRIDKFPVEAQETQELSKPPLLRLRTKYESRVPCVCNGIRLIRYRRRRRLRRLLRLLGL